MTGYQEVFTDPSYSGQIVVMTAPQIGNYGINAEDPESARPQITGVVVRELSRSYSNWRATGDLESWLTAANIPVLQGVDTRRLTRHLRSAGVMRGVIAPGEEPTRSGQGRARCVPFDGRPRSREPSDDARAVWVGRSAGSTPHRRVRLRYQAQHSAAFLRPRLPSHGGSRRHAGQ